MMQSSTVKDKEEAPSWLSSETLRSTNLEPEDEDIEAHGDESPSESKESRSRESEESQRPSEARIMEEMQRAHLVLRLLYISASTFIGVVAGLSMIGETHISTLFFTVYILFFCLMICCFECAFSGAAHFIAVNFGFLYTMIGRLAFVALLCFMSFTLGFLGLIGMCFLAAIGIFHIYILCKYPGFENYLRKKHYYAGRREEAEIKKSERRGWSLSL